MKRSFYLLLPALFFSLKAAACSCFTPAEINMSQLNSYTGVFTAKILKVDVKDGIKTALVAIDKAYKGVVAGDTIEVHTAPDGAACGLYFEEGQNWFLFVYDHDGEKHTGLCTRSTQIPVEDKHQKSIYRQDLKFVKKYGSYCGMINDNAAKGRLENGFPVGQWMYFEDDKLVQTVDYNGEGGVISQTFMRYEGYKLVKSEMFSGNRRLRTTYYNEEGKVERVEEHSATN